VKKLVVVSAAIAVLSFANSAFGADMPVKAAALAPYIYNWGGWYLGGNIGYGWGVSSDPSVSSVDTPATGFTTYFAAGGNVTPNVSPKGVIGGLQFGYNWMLGPNWVLGLVTDFQASGVNASGANVVTPPGPFATSIQANSLQTDWFGTIRAKVGWAQNNWLVYGTGGLAYGQVKPSGSFSVVGAPPFTGSNSTTKAGWAVGAGVDYGVTRNWSVGLEYLYVDLGRVSYTETEPFLAPASLTISNRDAMHIGRITANYKF